jgi:flagellar biosynthesis/type III secretory pathway protein FliH
MKFKINKMQVGLLARQFETKDPMPFEEIELELVKGTAQEAQIIQNIETKAYQAGYNRGYDEGLWNGKNNRTKCLYCGESRQRLYSCYCCSEDITKNRV